MNVKTAYSYGELLQLFPPRPINSEAQYQVTQQMIDSLLGKSSLTSDEEEYLDLLGTLVYVYEEEHEVMPELRGVELIKACLSERELRQKDLIPIFKTESIVSAVLNGRRKLTAEHIHKLAAFFHLPADLFFETIQA